MIGRRPLPAAAGEVFECYADAPSRERAHLRVRWRTCPFEAIAARVPETGRVLDYGCGHGLLAVYLALESSGRDVLGVEVDDRKIVAGRAAAAFARLRGARLAIAIAPGAVVPDGPWDAITVVDVCYLLPEASQRGLLEQAAARLAPGGVLLVKEMAPTPSWKARWNRLQETLAVRIMKLTAASTPSFCFVAPATIRSWLEGAGLRVEEVRLDRGFPHPHALVVGRRPLCHPSGRAAPVEISGRSGQGYRR